MATNQAINARALQQTRPLRLAVMTGAVLAIVLALAIALALAAAGPSRAPGITADRAVTEALVQVRKDEREERFAPSVDEIRRALIQFRTSEREERAKP
jgi:membrane glycosyltransferase